MVGWDNKLENIQSGRAIQEGQAIHCAHVELTISRGSICKISLQGRIFLLTLCNILSINPILQDAPAIGLGGHLDEATYIDR